MGTTLQNSLSCCYVYIQYNKHKPNIIIPSSYHSRHRTVGIRFTTSSNSYRPFKAVSAITSEESDVSSSIACEDVFKLTYLEGNSWLWEVNGSKILVDPILVGNLDFGIPWLYNATKRFLKNYQLNDLPKLDCLLITQSLDDHCHITTLEPLAKKFPNLRVISTPNAKSLLDPIFTNVTYLEPGESSEIEGNNGSRSNVLATPGPVLGPPWQRPENGMKKNHIVARQTMIPFGKGLNRYLITSPQGQLRLYYEPHCVYNKELLENEKADIVITPVIKQLLPYFTLVSGQEDAVQLAKILNAKCIVPMRNGDLESKGLLASIIQSEGTIASFKELLSRELPNAVVRVPTPGVPLDISPTL